MTDNTMDKTKGLERAKKEIMVYKTLHRKLKPRSNADALKGKAALFN